MNTEEAVFEKALRFLWEKLLEQNGIQANIIVIKKPETEKVL